MNITDYGQNTIFNFKLMDSYTTIACVVRVKDVQFKIVNVSKKQQISDN
jgi:hypothetical protein